MQLDQGRRDVLGPTQAEHQSGSCILDELQWLQRGRWQCRQHAVTVVQPGHYEHQDQLLCDFPADPTTNLAQTTNVVEASRLAAAILATCSFIVSSESI